MRGLLYLFAFLYEAFGPRTQPQAASTPTSPRPQVPLPTPEEDRRRDRKNDLQARVHLAEYRISRLRQLSGEYKALEAQVEQAQGLLDEGRLDECEALIGPCIVAIEQATYQRAWHRQLVALTYFLTGQRDDLSAVQAWNTMPPQMVTTRADEALSVKGVDDGALFLLSAALTDIMQHDTCAGRWQHFIYPRLPNYQRAAELTQGRLAFARTKFGPDSAQVLMSLTDLAVLHNQNGMYYGTPGWGATRDQARDKRQWESDQYATGWKYAAEALAICDRVFGCADDRTDTALVRLMVTTRPLSLPVPEDLQRRLNACKERIFGTKKVAKKEEPAESVENG